VITNVVVAADRIRQRIPGLPPLRRRLTPPVIHVDVDASQDDLAAETLVAAPVSEDSGVEDLEIWGEDDDEWGEGDEPTAAHPAIEEDPELGVALVTDTWMDLPSAEEGRRDLMDVYEALKKIARRDLGAVSVQLGNLEGHVIASTIRKLKRRDTVAAFSAQAMEFARQDAAGRRFTVLDAGKTHVFVVEVDHKRLLTMLFEERPDAQIVMNALRSLLEEIRGPDA
jgi:hypothetical protein